MLLYEDHEEGTLFALKVFHDETYLEREKVALSRLADCHHVAKIRKVANLPSELRSKSLPLAYYPNGDLFAFMEAEGSLDVRLAKTVFRECLIGLQNAHVNGVIHRDIKPENIFIDEDFHAHIGDFGLASVVDTSSNDRTLADACGTSSYSAPEVFDWVYERASYDGCKAEVWSMGCIFFLMLTGNNPFGADCEDNDDWFFRQIKRGNLASFWRGHEKYSRQPIPEEAKIVFESIFTIKPDDRPSVESLLDDCWLNLDLLPNPERIAAMKQIKTRMDGFEMK